MPKYKCNNKLCPKYDELIVENSTIKFKKGKIVDSSIKCPYCSKDREVMIEEGMTTYMSGSDNICKH